MILYDLLRLCVEVYILFFALHVCFKKFWSNERAVFVILFYRLLQPKKRFYNSLRTIILQTIKNLL